VITQSGVGLVARPVEVAVGVHVFTSRREQTTSTMVVSGSAALLVDPGWDPDELAGIAAFAADQSLTITAGFATHAHYDHLLWHRDFGDAPRWASSLTAATAKRDRKALVRGLGPDFPHSLGKLVGRVAPVASSSVPLPFGIDGSGETVEVITHDGHVPGHSALWLPARCVLLAGDMLSDVELPLPAYRDDSRADQGELLAYLAGLDALAPYVARADVLVPGHGRPTDRAMQRLDADRRYVDDLLNR
jgi:glyoxylase-like metal-dependent hydrolase (beta-lactamase superfamily II)